MQLQDLLRQGGRHPLLLRLDQIRLLSFWEVEAPLNGAAAGSRARAAVRWLAMLDVFGKVELK
jgi:hypothetical protein